MIKRPEVSLANHEAMFDYYRTSRQRPALARLTYRALRHCMDTRVSYDTPSTEAALANTADQPLLIISNHPTNTHDQFHAGAAIEASPLKAKIGSIAVAAKMELFNGPPPTRYFVDSLGALPTVRSSDYDELPPESQASTREHVQQAYTDMCAQALIRGDSLYVFPEGTRTKAGEQLSPLRKGFAHIARAAMAHTDTPLTIAPMGISYPSTASFRARRHAEVTFLAPYAVDPQESTDEIVEHATDVLRHHLEGYGKMAT